jgi:RNA polymerase sigma-70 factor (ECF subfamily)
MASPYSSLEAGVAISGIRLTRWETQVDDRDYSALAIDYQRGDHESFERLVNTLTRPLIAMAYRYTGDWEWARDLTQETWVKVHRRIRDYDPAKSFRAWLFAIHRRGCLDHLRRAWVRYESAPGEETLRGLCGVARSGNPDDELERREFQRRLLAAVGELGENQRQVFVRVDLEQCDQQEAARSLGMKYSTLRATLHAARRRLAAALRRMEESL